MTQPLRYTNKHNLPAEVVAAITKDRYTDSEEAPSDFSASSMVAPIQKTILERRHPDKLKVFDVLDDFWSFIGSIAHAVLEEAWHESMGSKVEERLYMAIHGKTISGKMDCYHNGMIRDYKTTKVYKIMKADYTDWEIQMNIYAELCRENGWPVQEIKIIPLLLDWKEGESYKQGYPKAQILVLPIRLWDQTEARKWINNRILDLLDAQKLTDEELAENYPCSDHERWADFRDYAILKEGAARATKCFETQEEAEKFFAEKGFSQPEHRIEKRIDPPKRCMRYCAAATVCKQWEKDKEKVGEASDTPGDAPAF